MNFFSRRRYSQFGSSYFDVADETITISKQINDDLGFSITLDTKSVNTSYILVKSTFAHAVARVQFYHLPRRIRGRSTAATQATEWVELDVEPIVLVSNVEEVLEFDHRLTRKLRPGTVIVAAITINGQVPPGSFLTVPVLKLITSKEATEIEVEDSMSLMESRIESRMDSRIDSRLQSGSTCTSMQTASICLPESMSSAPTTTSVSNSDKLLLPGDTNQLISVGNFSERLNRLGAVSKGSIVPGFGAITTNHTITAKKIAAPLVDIRGAELSHQGDYLVMGSSSKQVAKVDINKNTGFHVTGNITTTGSLFQVVPIPGTGFNNTTKWANRTFQGLLDVTGLVSSATIRRVIGKSVGVSHAHVGRLDKVGNIVFMMIKCLKAPTVGDKNIDFFTNAASLAQGEDAQTGGEYLKLDDHYGEWQVGDVAYCEVPNTSHYLYIATGTGKAGTYGEGLFLVTIYTT